MAAKKKSAATKKTTSALPRNEKKNLILRLVKGNADIKARESIDALKKKGITVTSNYVYKVLNAGKDTTTRAPRTANGSSTRSKNSSSSDAKAAFTRAVQDLGVARARKLLDILAKLESA